MRSVLVGAVESSLVTLETMLTVGVPPLAVVTLQPELGHRHSDFVDLAPTADSASVPVVFIDNVNTPDSLREIRALRPDYLWVVGWSQLCGQDFLAIPTAGTIGYHPAPLHKNRGRAVIAWTILQGARSTGSTLFWIGEGMDDGDIIAQRSVPVAPDETAESLVRKHMEALSPMVESVINCWRGGSIPSTPQDHSQATYCARRVKEDGLVDWTQSAEDVWRFIRAVGKPYPGAFSFMDGLRHTFWSAELHGPEPVWAQPGQVISMDDRGPLVQCGDGLHVRLTEIQREDGSSLTPRAVGRRFAQYRKGFEW